MELKHAINRGTNLLGAAIVGLAGFAFMSEMFLEDEFTHKIDDFLLLVLGIVAIVWYRVGNNRFSRSVVPVVLVAVALVVKIGAVILEFKDSADVGDDMGALVLFVLATALMVMVYRRAGRELAAGGSKRG